MSGSGKGFTKKMTQAIQPRELGGKVSAQVKGAAQTSCRVLNVLNPSANACLVVGQANTGLMISQLRINMWLLG